MGKSAADHDEQTIKEAIRAFRHHHLIRGDCDNGRWLIARKYDDGTLRSEYATEIISLWGGRLFVGGDIDDCVFAYYSEPKGSTLKGRALKDFHEDKLCWIGRCQDVSYYVAQKARIGLTDNGKLTETWDKDIARHEIKEALKEPDLRDEDRAAYEEALELCDNDDAEHEVLSYLYKNLYDPYDMPDGLGKRLAARVIYAWAACRKLCQILDGPATDDRYAKYDIDENTVDVDNDDVHKEKNDGVQ